MHSLIFFSFIEGEATCSYPFMYEVANQRRKYAPLYYLSTHADPWSRAENRLYTFQGSKTKYKRTKN